MVAMKHVQWMEYDPDTNEMKIQMIGKPDPDVYGISPDIKERDPNVVKRTFLSVVRELRSDGEMIECW